MSDEPFGYEHLEVVKFTPANGEGAARHLAGAVIDAAEKLLHRRNIVADTALLNPLMLSDILPAGAMIVACGAGDVTVHGDPLAPQGLIYVFRSKVDPPTPEFLKL